MRAQASELHRETRGGERQETDEGAWRLRAGATWKWSERLSLVGRVATIGNTSGTRWRVGAFESIQSSSGLASGDVTLDLAYLSFKPRDNLQLRFGRFQETIAVPGVPDKSLDRKDSDGLTVTYTDGASLDWHVGDGWSLLAIAQHNPPAGGTNRPRAPLDFTDHGSRTSGFFALRKTQDDGFWALRSLNLTWLPESRIGSTGETSDYTGMVADVGMRWPTNGKRRHLLFGGAVAHAPDAPATVDGFGRRDWAYQATANLMNFARLRQSIGVVWMQTGAGWLLSPDLAANSTLWEIRYRFNPLEKLQIETRYRYRSDVEQVPLAAGFQRDRDWYLRATWRM
jgi:hypothetical protein